MTRLPALPRGRRKYLAVALAVVLLAAAVGVISLVTRDRAIRTSALTVDGTAEPDGNPVQIDATLYLPATTPAPAVLLAHGFGGSKDDLTKQARALARRGFVVLAYTARGFGESGGLIHLDAPDYEVADARKLVDYLATSPAVRQDVSGDPRVGVAGASYGGALSLLLAGSDPRIDAVAADITWNDLSHALFPNGAGPDPGVFKKFWAGLLFQAGFGTDAATLLGTTPLPAADQPQPTVTACGRFAPDLCAAYQKASETGVADATIVNLLRASSPAGVLNKIKAPTLLSQGEQDSLFPLTEADANARGIAANGTPVKVLWRSGGHDTGGDGGAPAAAASWFEDVLNGNATPTTAFELSERGSALSATSGRRISQRLVVDGGYSSASRAQAITVQGSPQTINSPAGGNPAAVTSLPGIGGLLDLAANLGSSNPAAALSAIPGQNARFVSPPLTDRLLVAGASTISLSITSSTTDAVLFVSLRDLSPDGESILPAGLVTPVRLTGLQPGMPRTVEVTLPGIVTEVPVGHRVEVSVATTDLAYQLPADPRSYRVLLGAPTVSVPTVSARVVRAGHPFAWVVAGLVVAGLAAAVATVSTLRLRRRAGRPDPSLADVPIVVTDLVKEYADGYRAVDGVSFSVETGQVVGLLGPNGAGKTTVLRMLVGLITPTEGRIHLFGEPVVPGAAVLARLGSFIEGPGFLPHLSGRDNLRLYWAAAGRPQADADFDTALDIAGLGASIDRKVKTYSQGMRQRLAIAQAMLGLPELLVLDEPTNGLDPPQIAEMREVLKRYAETGRTVVVSSHLLAEVEQTCTHVVVMHKGQLIKAGSVTEVAGAGGTQLAVDDVGRASDVLASAGISSHPVPARRALEDVFLALIGGEE